MITKVKFVVEAAHEFREAVSWYKSRLEGLDIIFLNEINKTIERIKFNPYLYPIIVENIRRAQVEIFPYSIYYKVEEHILIILRLFHNKRKPIDLQSNWD